MNNNIVVLETYPSNEMPYDGLSGVFNEVKNIGTILPDTKELIGAKVLVLGIAPLYEHKIAKHNTNVIFTTFESDEVPLHWVNAINNYNYCIVPHDDVKSVFVNSGITIPVTVIHQGYQRFHKDLKKDRLANEFNVGFLGIPVNRKNLVKLYEACKTLQQTYIPQLKLHIHVSSFYDWLDATPFLKLKSDNMVVWTSGKYDNKQISEWYHRLSCYIFPSSGEGWSYTPRESMYLGIPTIITDIPVHKELIESGFCKVIKTAGREVADFHGAFHGNWAKIEVSDICEAILEVYHRYDYFSAQALLGSNWIANRWQNHEITQRLSEFMNAL